MTKKSSMTLETVDINDLQAHPRNYRGHPAEQIAHLKASLAEYGIVKNIVVASDNVILAGHGLVQAAREAGYKELPVCRIAMPSTDPKAQKFMVLDNEVSRKSEDDGEQLAALLKELQDSQYLTGTGYDSDEVTQLLNDLQAEEFGATLNEDAGPEEPPIEPVTRLGDIWLMGEHRLVCGDCTEVTLTDGLFKDKRAQLVFTDPPYGIDYVAQSMIAGQYDNIEADAAKDIGFLYEVWGLVWFANTTDTATCYVFNSPAKPETRIGVEKAGWQIKDTIAWVKPTFAPGRNDYQNKWEPLLYCRKAVGHYWCGRRDLGNVWEFGRDAGIEHPTNKPVELVAHGIKNSSKYGEIVFDPFMGSGTTLIAAEQTGRICYGIELEPRYVDVAVKRWQKLTGKQAILESTGEAFDGE